MHQGSGTSCTCLEPASDTNMLEQGQNKIPSCPAQKLSASSGRTCLQLGTVW